MKRREFLVTTACAAGALVAGGSVKAASASPLIGQKNTTSFQMIDYNRLTAVISDIDIIKLDGKVVDCRIMPKSLLKKLTDIRNINGSIGDSREIVKSEHRSHVTESLHVDYFGRMKADIRICSTPSGVILRDVLERYPTSVNFKFGGRGGLKRTDGVVSYWDADFKLLGVNAIIDKDLNEGKRLAIDPSGNKKDIYLHSWEEMPSGYRWL